MKVSINVAIFHILKAELEMVVKERSLGFGCREIQSMNSVKYWLTHQKTRRTNVLAKQLSSKPLFLVPQLMAQFMLL